MTTLPSSAHFPMDFSTLDEKMDLSSTPLQGVDDLDFEFDEMENQNLIPYSDNPMHDVSEANGKIDEMMQGEDLELFEDEQMREDDHSTIEVQKDLEMVEEPNAQAQEDEILYDEEDETTVADPEVSQIIDPAREQQQQPQQPQQPEEELFDFDEADHIDTSAGDQQILQAMDQNVDESSKSSTQSPTGGQVEAVGQSRGNSQPSVEQQQATEATIVSQDTRKAVTHLAESGEPKREEELELADDEEGPTFHETKVEEHGEDSLEAVELPGYGNPTEHGISGGQFHPVTLIWNHQAYSLFPTNEDSSDSQPFITDTALAFEPMEVLLQACRDHVQTALGGVADHIDEFELRIPDLALHICQRDRRAETLTFSDILNLVLTLHDNGETDKKEPLRCELNGKVSVETQYNWLCELATNDKISYKAITEICNPSKSGEGHESDERQELEDETYRQGIEVAGDELYSGAAGVAGSPGEDGVTAEHNADLRQEDKSIHERPNVNAVPDDVQNELDDNLGQTLQDDLSGADVNQTADAGIAYQHTEIGADAADTLQQGEDAEPAADESIYFEDAFDNEDDAEAEAEAEQTEDALEQTEDARALHEEQHQLDFEDDIEVSEQIDLGDDHEESEPLEAQGEAESEREEDEDLFINPHDVLEADEDPDATFEGRDVELDQTAKPAATVSDGAATNGNHVSHEPGNANGAEVVQPVTPSKARTSKRKVDEDEDDLLDLDFDTPEPKRRRPS